MKLFPAIDMRNGQCVRLSQGRFEDTKVYAEDPAEVARMFESAGARYLHTVDLDGALAGAAVNLEALRRITDSISIPVQNGGGRSDSAFKPGSAGSSLEPQPSRIRIF